MVATAFVIVLCQFLAGVSDDVYVVSFIISGVSALVGIAMIGLSILFAFCIAIADDFAPLRESNLRQCLHMFVMGLFALGPSVLLIMIGIWTEQKIPVAKTQPSYRQSPYLRHFEPDSFIPAAFLGL